MNPDRVAHLLQQLLSQHDLDRIWMDTIHSTLIDHAERLDLGKEGRYKLQMTINKMATTIADNDAELKKTIGLSDANLKIDIVNKTRELEENHQKLAREQAEKHETIIANLDTNLRNDTKYEVNKLREELGKTGGPASSAASGDQKFLHLQLKAKIEAAEHYIEAVQKEVHAMHDGLQALEATLGNATATIDRRVSEVEGSTYQLLQSTAQQAQQLTTTTTASGTTVSVPTGTTATTAASAAAAAIHVSTTTATAAAAAQQRRASDGAELTTEPPSLEHVLSGPRRTAWTPGSAGRQLPEHPGEQCPIGRTCSRSRLEPTHLRRQGFAVRAGPIQRQRRPRVAQIHHGSCCAPVPRRITHD